MLRKLLKMLFGWRAKPELEFVPVRPIPISPQLRRYDKPTVTAVPLHDRYGWGKPPTNQLSS